MDLRARDKGSGDRGEPCTRTGAVTAQPRPALGRRPWFALLRLARSLRLFALAMARRLPARAEVPYIVTLHARGGGWASPPVVVAATVRDRLLGLTPWSLGIGLLLPGGDVHGRGMVERLSVVGINREGMVTEITTLAPGARCRLDGAAAVLELGQDQALPAVGAQLLIRPMLAPCRGDSSSAQRR